MGEGGDRDEIVVEGLPPMEDINVGAEPPEDGEDGNVASSTGGSKQDTGAGGSVARMPWTAAAVVGEGIAGVLVQTLRQSRYTHASLQTSNFSDLMQFMIMQAEMESAMEQRHHQEHEDSKER